MRGGREGGREGDVTYFHPSPALPCPNLPAAAAGIGSGEGGREEGREGGSDVLLSFPRSSFSMSKCASSRGKSPKRAQAKKTGCCCCCCSSSPFRSSFDSSTLPPPPPPPAAAAVPAAAVASTAVAAAKRAASALSSNATHSLWPLARALRKGGSERRREGRREGGREGGRVRSSSSSSKKGGLGAFEQRHTFLVALGAGAEAGKEGGREGSFLSLV